MAIYICYNRNRKKLKGGMKVFKIVENGKADARVFFENDKVYEFAAKELEKYVKLLTDCDLDGEKKIYIGSLGWIYSQTGKQFHVKHDGFVIDADEQALVLTGGEKRSALYAVYALIHSLGVRWYFPGDDGEFLPERTDTLKTELKTVSEPDMSIRNYTYDGPHDGSDEELGVWTKEMGDAIDWFAKMGINAVYFCEYPYDGIAGLKYICEQCAKRGIMVELGGHGVQELVKKSLFESEPELFREKDGKRDSSGNFCSSNPKAVQMVCDGVSKLFKDFPWLDISVLHLWFDDVEGGSWCSCEKCKDKTPTEQLMTVINAVSERMKKEKPDLMLDIILYHDTLDMSGVPIQPNEGIYGFFCPRERCRYHSIAESGCAKNERQMTALKKDIEYFGADKMYIFEYYADFILFINLGIHIPSIIIKDIKEYKALNVDKICNLMFGKYSWWAYHGNMYAFNRACWDINYDSKGEHEEKLLRMYGKYAKEMGEYYELFEQASMKMLAFCEYGDNISDLRNIPPQCPDFYQKHIAMIEQAVALYEKAYELLQKLCQMSQGEKEFTYIEREMYLMQTTALDARAVCEQMTGRILGYLGDVPARHEHFDEAIKLREKGAETMATVPLKYNGRCGEDAVRFYGTMNEWYQAMKKWG
ncbi:MAG: DUF4838 domain-containing protein [Ruminococcaceae bacterium]|nr:DUF4838 domain-containing protein [Oscillospiraceae bacterium]